MKRFRLGFALCLVPAAVLADGLDKAAPILTEGRGQGCGGDAYTFAEVVPAAPGTRDKGPIMVLPDTLCADLAAGLNTRIDSLNVFIETGGAAGEQPQKGFPQRQTPYRRY